MNMRVCARRIAALAAIAGFIALTGVPGDSAAVPRLGSIRQWQGRYEIRHDQDYTILGNHYVMHYKARGHFTVSFHNRIVINASTSAYELRGPGKATVKFAYNESAAVPCGTNLITSQASGGGKIEMLFQIYPGYYVLRVSKGIKIKEIDTSVTPLNGGACKTTTKVHKVSTEDASGLDISEHLPPSTPYICGHKVERETDHSTDHVSWEIYPVGMLPPRHPHCPTFPLNQSASYIYPS